MQSQQYRSAMLRYFSNALGVSQEDASRIIFSIHKEYVRFGSIGRVVNNSAELFGRKIDEKLARRAVQYARQGQEAKSTFLGIRMPGIFQYKFFRYGTAVAGMALLAAAACTGPGLEKYKELEGKVTEIYGRLGKVESEAEQNSAARKAQDERYMGLDKRVEANGRDTDANSERLTGVEQIQTADRAKAEALQRRLASIETTIAKFEQGGFPSALPVDIGQKISIREGDILYERHANGDIYLVLKPTISEGYRNMRLDAVLSNGVSIKNSEADRLSIKITEIEREFLGANPVKRVDVRYNGRKITIDTSKISAEVSHAFESAMPRITEIGIPWNDADAKEVP